MFDRNRPHNNLPALPPACEIKTSSVLKKAISASRAMAELKGMAERMPNQAMLIDSLLPQEARASSEIENILTTNDATRGTRHLQQRLDRADFQATVLQDSVFGTRRHGHAPDLRQVPA
jgi:Fic family protein